MNKKLVSTLFLVAILFVIAIGGGVYAYYFQAEELESKEKELKGLKVNAENTEELEMQLADLKVRVAELDSILSLRKFIIPTDLKQSSFFKFVNKASSSFSEQSHVNVTYSGAGKVDDFYSYTYSCAGTAEFNDFFKLAYAIEQSKELKKISGGTLNNFVEVDDDGVAHYLVNYSMNVKVYYADNDQYSSSDYRENRLKSNPLYNVFYPLIREKVAPNTKNLLDVQTAQLLAIIPDGAYVTDASGKTALLWEGDEVYLGYLTKIDFETNEVKFILNKGGIIEKITLNLDPNSSENDNKLTSK
ncbi:MAG: hypothetical protein V3V16_14935 [Melioribacteraceae bacterium]